jgi:hypothetical protein
VALFGLSRCNAACAQADGRSRGYGAGYHAGNIYATGHVYALYLPIARLSLCDGSPACLSNSPVPLTRGRMGSFSFGTKHMDGSYSDHAGVKTPNHHDSADTALTSLHATGSDGYNGMDLFISKMSEAGVPSPTVLAADVAPHSKEVDGQTSTRSYGWMAGVAGFPGATNDDTIAAIACHVGDLTVPMADGTNKVIENPKFTSFDYNGISPLLT